jgi:hypothetical protein
MIDKLAANIRVTSVGKCLQGSCQDTERRRGIDIVAGIWCKDGVSKGWKGMLLATTGRSGSCSCGGNGKQPHRHSGACKLIGIRNPCLCRRDSQECSCTAAKYEALRHCCHGKKLDISLFVTIFFRSKVLFAEDE